MDKIIVVGRGPSVNSIHPDILRQYCRQYVSIGCNDAALSFDTDIIVALDPEWIRVRAHLLSEHTGKILVTKDWTDKALKNPWYPELPTPTIIKAKEYTNLRLSGQMAVQLGNILANEYDCGCMVIGIDGDTNEHYNGDTLFRNDIGAKEWDRVSRENCHYLGEKRNDLFSRAANPARWQKQPENVQDAEICIKRALQGWTGFVGG